MKLVTIILSLCLVAGVGHGVWLYLTRDGRLPPDGGTGALMLRTEPASSLRPSGFDHLSQGEVR